MPKFTHHQDTVVVAAGHAIRFVAGEPAFVPDDAGLIRAVQAAGAVQAADKPAEPAEAIEVTDKTAEVEATDEPAEVPVDEATGDAATVATTAKSAKAK